MSNVDARSMWVAQGTVDKLYFGRRGAAKLGELSSIFMPSDGGPQRRRRRPRRVVFESAYYEGGFGAKTFKRLYVDYELTDYGTDDPRGTISYITPPMRSRGGRRDRQLAAAGTVGSGLPG
jgi:hypothetical protein